MLLYLESTQQLCLYAALLYKRVRPEAGIIGVVGIVAPNIITVFRHDQRNAIPNDSFAAGCRNSLYNQSAIPFKDDNIPIGQISVYFYRDKDMNEIDLLIEENGTLYPLEMKKHADPQKKDMDAFDLLDKIPGVRRGPGGVICL